MDKFYWDLFLLLINGLGLIQSIHEGKALLSAALSAAVVCCIYLLNRDWPKAKQ